jgi:protocatechuate 3,4-dioxygenase beta subunit
MSQQQRVATGLVALLVLGGLVAGGAYFLAGEPTPAPVAPPAENRAPAPGPAVKKEPTLPTPTQPIAPIKSEAFNPTYDRASARDSLSIGGTVVDPAGNPIAGAAVELVYDFSAVISRAQEADVRGSFTTEADGRFYFSAETCPGCGLNYAERYVLRVRHNDYAVERVSGVEVRDPRSENRTIMLSPAACVVMGFCRDVNGAPVAGAEVRVYDLNVSSTDPDGSVERSSTTAGDGSFAVKNVKPGLKKIWAVRSGYASTGRPTQSLTADKPELRVDFSMRPGHAISGVLVAQDTGLGVTGAYVTVKPTRLGSKANDPVARKMAEAERRRGGGVDPTSIEEMRRAAADGASKEDMLRIQREAKEAAMRRRTEGGREAAEHVDGESTETDADRKEHFEAARRSQEIAAQQQNMQLTSLSFRTDAEGRFKADGLEEGAYQITVNAPGYMPPPIQSAETGGEAVSFSLVPNARILGRVVDEESGQPIAAFTVGLSPTADGATVPYHMKKPFGPPKSQDGSFEYVDVRPGTYFLIAEATGFAGGRSEQIVIGQSERREGVEIKLSRGATVRGKVVDAQGKTVADATVTLEAASATTGPGAAFMNIFTSQLRRDVKETRTLPDGTYRLPNILDGRYTLKVRHPDFGPFDDPNAFDVPKKGEVERPDVNLARGGGVRGRVLTKDGAPDPQAMVTISPTVAGSAFNQRQANTDTDGRFEVSGLAPGEYRVVVGMRGGQVDLGPLLQAAAFNAQRTGGVAPPAGMTPPKTVTLTEGQTVDVGDL